jgi:4a-hydroxytetrahydrobiopterin dehydratase
MTIHEPVHRHHDGLNHDVCDGSARALTDAEIHLRTSALPGWHLREDRLHRTFRFATFAESMRFVHDLGKLAEVLNHHPNFCVEDKRRVHVVLWTHQMSCLTEHDFVLASALSQDFDRIAVGVA